MKNAKFLSCILSVALFAAALGGCAEVQNRNEPDSESTSAEVLSSESSTEEASTEVVVKPDLKYRRITLTKKDEQFVLYGGLLKGIVWTSLDEKIAVVENGIVSAVAEGETDIKAEYKGEVTLCKVVCAFKEEEAVLPPKRPIYIDAPVVNVSHEREEEFTDSANVNPRAPVIPMPQNQVVGSSFFDNAAFVGDSISLKLSYYAAKTGCLGNATFLVRGSYGLANELYNGFHIIYRGQSVKLETALKQSGVQKVFIMLGTNDIAAYGVDKTISNWGILIGRIQAEVPNINIYIQSMMPVWTGGETRGLNNRNVNSYNEKLRAFAQSHGCSYIDVASYMRDSTGGLATEYCGDRYVHLTDKGAKAWVAVLKAYKGY